jgi:16S rRNA (guanine527-N7)-methyltransferase
LAPSPPPSTIPLSLLKSWAERLSCEAPTEALDTLCRYGELIAHWNRKKRLVGRATAAEIAGIHLADALALAGQLQRLAARGTLLDVGSGAGLPGFALAVLLPQLEVSLCDVSEKRVAFLHHARARLQVDVTVLHEEVARIIDRGERYDHVVSRAVFEPRRWLEIGEACLAKGGHLWAMLTAEQFERETFPKACHEYEVEGDRKRILLRMEGPGFT